MKLEDIKKLSKRRAKTKNPTAPASKNVYGGVGVYTNHGSSTTTPPTDVGGGGGGGGGDGGGDGGGGGE